MKQGAYYLSTGWGGNGTDSGFYGGIFKNLPDSSQLTLPADPWFNVWVLNQTNATVDSYNLEVTIREDLDCDGWSDGADESFRYDATNPSGSFDDAWTILSAPVSSFTDLAPAGDGAVHRQPGRVGPGGRRCPGRHRHHRRGRLRPDHVHVGRPGGTPKKCRDVVSHP